MNALAELRKRALPAANPANPANRRLDSAPDSQDSQDSQGGAVENNFSALPTDSLKAEHARLLALAAAEWIDAAHVHRLHDADLAACLCLTDHQRATFLHLLADAADRHAGRVPMGDTAAMYCEACGPVWIHPAIVDVLPKVDGWPRALGCPWCFVRKARGYIPRPRVACGDCRHFTPDAINAPAGIDTCAKGHGMHWAGERLSCASFQQTERRPNDHEA